MSSISVLLDDMDDRFKLIGPHVWIEREVTRSTECHIPHGTLVVAILDKPLCQKEKRGLAHHAAVDILKGRDAKPVAGQIMIM